LVTWSAKTSWDSLKIFFKMKCLVESTAELDGEYRFTFDQKEVTLLAELSQ